MTKVVRKLPVGTKKKTKVLRRDVGSAVEVTLPTARSVPSARLQDYIILLFGEKKIGKTDLTAQFDGVLHLMAEAGGKALSIFQRPVNSWKEFVAYVRLLEKDKAFDTVSVDTADLLYGLCFDATMQRLGLDHPSEEAYGKGWKAIRDEFTKQINRLIATGKGIIFVSHAAEKEIKMRDGAVYERIQPSLSGQAMDVLTALVDLWFYYGYDGSRRVLFIQGSDHIGAGHRLKNNFKYPDGSPVTEIDMGRNAEEGYANLIAAFGNSYQKRKAIDPDEDRPVVKKKKKLSIKKRT